MNSAQKRYYSVKEAAGILGVSTNTLYKYLDEGKIRSRRFGQGRFKIPVGELAPYLQGNQVSENSKSVRTIQVDRSILAPVPSQNPTPMIIDEIPATLEVLPKQPIVEDNTVLSFSVNDISIFRIFKAMVYLGLGIIYLIVTPTNTAFITEGGISLGKVLLTVFPYSLLMVGLLNLIEVIYDGRKMIDHFYIDVLTLVLSGYYVYLALSAAKIGVFVFAASLAGTALLHLISDIKKGGETHTFVNSFTKYKLLLAIFASVILTMNPQISPITTIISFIEGSRDFFIFLCFLLLIIPPIVILYQKTNKSIISIPYYSLTSVFLIVIGVKTMMTGNFDVSYICFLTGIFGLFLAWWIDCKVVIDIKKFKFMIATFSWIAIVLLTSLYTLNVFEKNQEVKVAQNLQLQVNDLTKSIRNKIVEREAVMISFSGREDVKKAIKSGDTEVSIALSKEIYDRFEHVDRVIIYDAGGIGVGVYPRNTLAQGANFSSRDYFQKTINGKESHISDVFQSVIGTTTIVQTVPVFENNEVIGVIGIATSPTHFYMAFGIDNFTGAIIEIVDQNGKFVIDKKTAGEAYTQEVTLYTLANTKEKTISLTRILNYPKWKVGVTSTQDSVVSGMSQLITSLTAIILMNALFSIFIGVASARKRVENNLKVNPVSDKPITSVPVVPRYI